LGNGRQYMSWIGIDDVVGAIHHAIMTDSVRGPVNATGPDPVTNAEFTKALAAVLGRPALFAVPATALRLLFGELADELLLSSLRVLPERLRASGYPFRFPTLGDALRHLLGR
jgi:NAD dependent epimerase/dehydratase family enzyme